MEPLGMISSRATTMVPFESYAPSQRPAGGCGGLEHANSETRQNVEIRVAASTRIRASRFACLHNTCTQQRIGNASQRDVTRLGLALGLGPLIAHEFNKGCRLCHCPNDFCPTRSSASSLRPPSPSRSGRTT